MKTITIDGKEYRLSQIENDHVYEAYAYFRKQRGNPFDALRGKLDGLPEAAQREAVRLAYEELRDGPSKHAFGAWLDEPEGISYVFWIMLRDGVPNLTHQQAGELIIQWLSEFVSGATEGIEESEDSVEIMDAAREAGMDKLRVLRNENYVKEAS